MWDSSGNLLHVMIFLTHLVSRITKAHAQRLGRVNGILRNNKGAMSLKIGVDRGHRGDGIAIVRILPSLLICISASLDTPKNFLVIGIELYQIQMKMMRTEIYEMSTIMHIICVWPFAQTVILTVPTRNNHPQLASPEIFHIYWDQAKGTSSHPFDRCPYRFPIDQIVSTQN